MQLEVDILLSYKKLNKMRVLFKIAVSSYLTIFTCISSYLLLLDSITSNVQLIYLIYLMDPLCDPNDVTAELSIVDSAFIFLIYLRRTP